MSPPEDNEAPARRGPGRFGRALLPAVAGLVALAVLALWLGRERLADNLIQDYLQANGVRATYDVQAIGPTRQVLANLVIGDPARPSFTAARVEVAVRPRFGLPDVTEVKLVRPRLYGTIRNGALSLGALDPLVFTGSKEPFALPRLTLVVEDGRGRIDGDHGAIGIRLDGRGPLQDGFQGELAAIAPDLAAGGCAARDASLYGQIAIRDEWPGFTGPLRFASLTCAAQGMAMGKGAAQLDVAADKALAAYSGTAGLDLTALAAGTSRLAGLKGEARFSWRSTGLTLGYDLAGTGLAAAGAGMGRIGIDGTLRARPNLSRVEMAGRIDGAEMRTGPALDRTLASAISATDGTLLAPLLHQWRTGLARQAPGSTLAGDYDLRMTDGRVALVMPGARLTGRGGQTLLSLSRLQYAGGTGSVPRLSGNFQTGGDGLPQITGRMEQRGAGATRFALRMAPWRAGSSVMEVPELAVVQGRSGALGFAGQVRASGVLPGGHVRDLMLPLSGNVTTDGRLAMWSRCTTVRFASLALAELTLEERQLQLCPPRGSAIVRRDSRGLRIAAGIPSLALEGRLGETPIALQSGAVGFAWPGSLSARQVAIQLGPRATASHFVIADLSARIGSDLAGQFAGTDVKLSAVPLDLLGASGTWRYAGGVLTLADAAFAVEDRQKPARFNPMQARGAQLTLADNVIRADAVLREPASDRVVSNVAVVHDLASARGHADLAVPGLLFDKGLQPTALTELARGLVANVAGTVVGSGRIDWTPQAVTSSGRFASDSLDLAAAFGPVKGASGTVVFTDLLGLTTAPDQRIRIASVNPGIEANDGEVSFQVIDGTLLKLGGGTWPFLGGRLTLRPIDMRFGNAETRHYVLELDGVDASRFVERMELSNLAVTGTFDGAVPIVFDENGNGRLEGGVLVSRPPGGNVSYVGQLTYEDMGAIPNFAFNALKSLDYKQMFLQMDGPLTGEIVARVRFDGVSQGAGAKRNFLTRQVARLPFRFNVNVRAPFYSLISSIRAMYDPAFIRDPREVGLIDAQGRPTGPQPPATTPIQPSESENRR